MEKNSSTSLTIKKKEALALFQRTLLSVREDMHDNPYIIEALKVLSVEGYRSAIGNFWNAVVDDLRNKIIHRSLKLFNKSLTLRREIKSYDDFQDHVNDDELLEGAYKIGVIGWEAHKILRHAKETRHIFDGHPKSSDPSPLKVLAMMDDCIKYVLNLELPSQIIGIEDYINIMGDSNFNRNEIAIENALGDLPEVYKNEFANRLYSAYTTPDASTILKSNIEFTIPILWNVLPKSVKTQIVKRVDQEINKGNIIVTNLSFDFIRIVDGSKFLSTVARKYKLQPIIDKLKNNFDEWPIENECTAELEPYAPYIPEELIDDYVWGLTHTYVGRIGSSLYFSRTDFYANEAAIRIPRMFEKFDDNAASSFISCVKTSDLLRDRIKNPTKLSRLRSLGNIVMEKVSNKFKDRDFLEKLVDETKEEAFFKGLKKPDVKKVYKKK